MTVSLRQIVLEDFDCKCSINEEFDELKTLQSRGGFRNMINVVPIHWGTQQGGRTGDCKSFITVQAAAINIPQLHYHCYRRV